MKPIVAALLALLALPAALSAQQPQFRREVSAPLPSVQLPPELERVLRDYERAWEARDAAGLAALFTEDGVVMGNGRPPVQGRAAVERAYAQAGGPLALRAFGFAADDSVAYILGAYAEEADQPDFGKFVLVLRRGADGRWLLAADIDNANRMMPPPPPPAAPRGR